MADETASELTNCKVLLAQCKRDMEATGEKLSHAQTENDQLVKKINFLKDEHAISQKLLSEVQAKNLELQSTSIPNVMNLDNSRPSTGYIPDSSRPTTSSLSSVGIPVNVR